MQREGGWLADCLGLGPEQGCTCNGKVGGWLAAWA